MQNAKLMKRSEVPTEHTWDLTDIFASDEAWAAENEAMKDLVPQFAAYQGKLGESAQTLLNFFKLEDEASLRLSKLHGYASCKGDQDTADGFYQDMRGKAMGTMVAISSATAFASSEIMAIDEEKLNSFYAELPALEEYRRSIYQIRRRAAHILSPAEEALLASAGEMANAPDNISSIFSNADLKFPDVMDGKGEMHPLSDVSFVPTLESEDRVLRCNTFTTYYKTLGQYRNTLAAALDAQFKQLRFFANARKYDSTLAAALDETEVPTQVYTNLLEAVHNNLDKMYRYVALRKKMMGVKELHMYDVYNSDR